MAAPVRMASTTRYRRPSPARGPVPTKTYAWKTVTVKVWWPTAGSLPDWYNHSPGV